MTLHSYAKVNIFLKITGTRDNYHLLASRFMRVKNLYDTLYIQEKAENKSFCLEGDFGCKTEQNTIYKAYKALLEHTKAQSLERFFHSHKIIVEKNIPSFAGLGGGSSNAACILNFCNQHLKLGLSKDTLASIGASVGSDIPFFVYEYDSANVEGIGEIVKPFDEDALNLEVITPNIECSTPEIFKTYRKHFFTLTKEERAQTLLKEDSKTLLERLSATEANDLFQSARFLYPQLNHYETLGYHFSGSGSSFFKRVY